MDTNVSYIIKNNILKGFAFKQEKMLVDVVRSGGTKLGCLRIETTCSKEETTTEIQKNQQQTEPLKPVLTMKADKEEVQVKHKHLQTGKCTPSISLLVVVATSFTVMLEHGSFPVN